MTNSLVLASGAHHRAELLRRLELPFIAVEHRFDERAQDASFSPASPDEYALGLALGKARSLSVEHRGAHILAADQIALLGEGSTTELLHKPATEARAIAQLKRMSARTHRLVTAVVLLDTRDGSHTHEIDRQRLTFRPLTDAEIEAYVRLHRPLDCAGSYRIEDAGIKLFSRIEGEDYTGIIGLPLLAVGRLLRSAELLE
jgi:septum formation protein